MKPGEFVIVDRPGLMLTATAEPVRDLSHVERQRLKQVAERAQVEADAGAPGPMVALYVAREVEHLIERHGGPSDQCDECP